MAVIVCEIHDLTACAVACPHILKSIEYRTFKKYENDILDVQITSVTIKRPFIKLIAYCSECKKKYLFPTLFFCFVYEFYSVYSSLALELDFEMDSVWVCIKCLYKELFDIELKEFYPYKGATDYTPIFTGKDFKVLMTKENKN